MGIIHSKPEDQLQQISRNTKAIRTSIKTSPQNITKEKKDSIVQELASSSNYISDLHGKVKQKKLDAALKDVRETMAEVLKIESKDLDGAAVETDSFVRVSVSRQPRNSYGSLGSKSSKKNQNTNRSNASNIREIESRFEELQSQIKTAIKNNDSNQLRQYREILKIMARDMEFLHAEVNTPLQQRKDVLWKKITLMFKKVNNVLDRMKKSSTSYQLSHANKNISLSELSEIEIQLAENESLLDQMNKNKNSSNFLTIRNNVVTINSRLNNVNIVDNDIKNRVILLTQKVTELVKNLDKLMSKREFESKYVKVQETFERIKKNFNVNKNAEETKKSLLTLEESIKNIDDIDEVSKKKKKDLLTDITNYVNIITISNVDSKTIREIVEENVVLRKKLKSSDKEYTIIDQFINYWNNIQNNIDLDAYSKLSLLRMDNVLDEMQSSIYNMRLGIANKCETNPPHLLSHKFSQSVPKLNDHRGSENSNTTQFDNGIIKTRAKIYNVSTPELLHATKLHTARFSHIEEVKRNVHYIREKIDENSDQPGLRSKLENYLKTLNGYTQDNNKSVVNNAIIVSNEITELLFRLTIVELKQRVDVTTKKVHNFNGYKYEKEFNDLRGELDDLCDALKTLNVPEQFAQLVEAKHQLLEEVTYCLQSLNNKPSFPVKHENYDVKVVKEKLVLLNDRVKRFSGTYKGVAYNNIERDLNKVLLDIGEYPEDNVTDQVTKDVERLLKILEQRASLAQSFKGTKEELMLTDDNTAVTKIKTDLMNIKMEIDKTPEDNVNKFIGLQSRLDLVNLELSQIGARSTEKMEKEKDILTNEASSLRNVVDAKITLGQKPVANWPDRDIVDPTSYPKTDVNKEMEKFESKFTAIKNEVNIPNTEDDIHKYYKLAQDTKKLIEKLEKYRFIKNTDLHLRQTRLLDEMQYYISVLEKEAKEVDYVLSLEKKVSTLESLLRSNEQRDLKSMAEELQTIQSKLNKCDVSSINTSIRLRKTSVQQKTEELAQKLKKIEDEENQFQEAEQKINEIEEKVYTLKPEINAFVGLQSDSKFYELDETTMRLILILDKLDVRNGELSRRKINLLKELHKLGNILDSRAQQTEELVDIENTLEKVSGWLKTFSNDEKDIDHLKDYVKNIGVQLNQLNLNSDLLERRRKCDKEYASILNEIAALENSLVNVYSDPPKISVSKSEQRSEHTTATGHTTKIYSVVVKKTREGVHFANNRVSKVIEDITPSLPSGLPPSLPSSLPPSLPSSLPPTLPNSIPPSLPWNPLSELENEVASLQFACLEADEEVKLNEIDEAINKCTIKLNELVFPRDSPEYKRRNTLFEKLENIASDIEIILAENQKVSYIEDQLDMLGDKMSGSLDARQIDELDQQFIQLQIDLGKINSPSLKLRVDACQIRLIFHLQTITEFKNAR